MDLKCSKREDDLIAHVNIIKYTKSIHLYKLSQNININELTIIQI